MIYVMSDIHGNGPKFESVMKQINLRPDDALYVLGDVIDRYPDGIKILRKLMSMPNVKMLLGNHEHMMLEALAVTYNMKDRNDRERYFRNLRLWYNNGGHETHSSLKHLRKTTRAEIFDYLQSLPVNLDIEVNGNKYRLAHAAPVELYNRYGKRYKSEKEFAIWYRLIGIKIILGDYTLIFGHTPTMYFQDEDVQNIWHENNMIGIDCRCGITNFYPSDYGRLGCLRLDDGMEFYSEPNNSKS